MVFHVALCPDSRLDLSQAYDIIPVVHKVYLSGNPFGKGTTKIEGGTGHFFLGDIATQRRLFRHVARNLIETAHSGGGQSLERPGGDGVYPGPVRPKGLSQVAD